MLQTAWFTCFTILRYTCPERLSTWTSTERKSGGNHLTQIHVKSSPVIVWIIHMKILIFCLFGLKKPIYAPP